MEIYASEININREEDGKKKMTVRLQHVGGWSSELMLDARVTLTPDELQGVNFLDDEQIEEIARQKLSEEIYDQSSIVTAEPVNVWERLTDETLEALGLDRGNDDDSVKAKTKEFKTAVDHLKQAVEAEFHPQSDDFEKAFAQLNDDLANQGETIELKTANVKGLIEDIKTIVEE